MNRYDFIEILLKKLHFSPFDKEEKIANITFICVR